MAVMYVNKSEYKIFLRKPSYGRTLRNTKEFKTFTYTTNNPKRLTGMVAKKGITLRYN